MVVDFETRPSKNGGQYGRLKLEDYSGSHEFMLFGQTFIDFHNYGVPGTPIILTGAWQRRFAGQDLRFNIKRINLLNDLKGKLIRGITIDIPREKANDHIADILAEHITPVGDSGGTLAIRVFDKEIRRSIRLSSPLRVVIDRDLVRVLDDEGLEYTVEK